MSNQNYPNYDSSNLPNPANTQDIPNEYTFAMNSIEKSLSYSQKLKKNLSKIDLEILEIKRKLCQLDLKSNKNSNKKHYELASMNNNIQNYNQDYLRYNTDMIDFNTDIRNDNNIICRTGNSNINNNCEFDNKYYSGNDNEINNELNQGGNSYNINDKYYGNLNNLNNININDNANRGNVSVSDKEYRKRIEENLNTNINKSKNCDSYFKTDKDGYNNLNNNKDYDNNNYQDIYKNSINQINKSNSIKNINKVNLNNVDSNIINKNDYFPNRKINDNMMNIDNKSRSSININDNIPINKYELNHNDSHISITNKYEIINKYSDDKYNDDNLYNYKSKYNNSMNSNSQNYNISNNNNNLTRDRSNIDLNNNNNNNYYYDHCDTKNYYDKIKRNCDSSSPDNPFNQENQPTNYLPNINNINNISNPENKYSSNINDQNQFIDKYSPKLNKYSDSNRDNDKDNLISKYSLSPPSRNTNIYSQTEKYLDEYTNNNNNNNQNNNSINNNNSNNNLSKGFKSPLSFSKYNFEILCFTDDSNPNPNVNEELLNELNNKDLIISNMYNELNNFQVKTDSLAKENFELKQAIENLYKNNMINNPENCNFCSEKDKIIEQLLAEREQFSIENNNLKADNVTLYQLISNENNENTKSGGDFNLGLPYSKKKLMKDGGMKKKKKGLKNLQVDGGDEEGGNDGNDGDGGNDGEGDGEDNNEEEEIGNDCDGNDGDSKKNLNSEGIDINNNNKNNINNNNNQEDNYDNEHDCDYVNEADNNDENLINYNYNNSEGNQLLNSNPINLQDNANIINNQYQNEQNEEQNNNNSNLEYLENETSNNNEEKINQIDDNNIIQTDSVPITFKSSASNLNPNNQINIIPKVNQCIQTNQIPNPTYKKIDISAHKKANSLKNYIDLSNNINYVNNVNPSLYKNRNGHASNSQKVFNTVNFSKSINTINNTNISENNLFEINNNENNGNNGHISHKNYEKKTLYSDSNNYKNNNRPSKIIKFISNYDYNPGGKNDISNKLQSSTNYEIYNYNEATLEKCIFTLYDTKRILIFNLNKKTFGILDFVDINSFSQNYKKNGSIYLNLKGNLYIVTGENCNLFYNFNYKNKSMNQLSVLNYNHSFGGLIFLKKLNLFLCLNGEFNKNVELFNKNNNFWDIVENETINERCKCNYLVYNNKYVFAFFGYNPNDNKYLNNIEYCSISNFIWDNANIITNNAGVNELFFKEFFVYNYSGNNMVLFGGFNGYYNENNKNYYDLEIIGGDGEGGDGEVSVRITKGKRIICDGNNNDKFYFTFQCSNYGIIDGEFLGFDNRNNVHLISGEEGKEFGHEIYNYE